MRGDELTLHYHHHFRSDDLSSLDFGSDQHFTNLKLVEAISFLNTFSGTTLHSTFDEAEVGHRVGNVVDYNYRKVETDAFFG